MGALFCFRLSYGLIDRVFLPVARFFYASSACIYPEFKQLETNVSLKESDAWPAEVLICITNTESHPKLHKI